MTQSERLALAVLRSGGSFADAMKAAKMSFETIKALWDAHGIEKRADTVSPS